MLILRAGLRRARLSSIPLASVSGRARLSTAAHTPFAAKQSEARLRLLQHALDKPEKPRKTKNHTALAAAAGLSLAGVVVLGHEFVDVIFTTRNLGSALLATGGAAAVYGSGWFRDGGGGGVGGDGPSRVCSTYKFRLLNPATQFSGAAESLGKLCGGSKFPLEVEEVLKQAREREEQVDKQALDARAASLLELVRSLSAPVADGVLTADGAVVTSAQPMSASEVMQKLAPRLFVIEYIDPPRRATSSASGRGAAGDGKSRAERFGDEISLVLSVASQHDEVLINLTSPGGSVSEYGLASSHILRLKQAGIKTTVAVDTVAASGGYMMAVCADRICAAPFAFIGSIGVVAELPNVNKLLTRIDVDWLQFTAGRFKRTITPFGETTVEARAKFQQDIELIHDAFKQHIGANRPLDVELVATGEAWLAVQAKSYGLVDELCTSHDVIMRMAAAGFDVVEITRKPPPRSLFSVFDRLVSMSTSAEGALGAMLARVPGFGAEGAAARALGAVPDALRDRSPSTFAQLDGTVRLSEDSPAARATVRAS